MTTIKPFSSADFPVVTHEAWRAEVSRLLTEPAATRTLNTRAVDGLVISALPPERSLDGLNVLPSWRKQAAPAVWMPVAAYAQTLNEGADWLNDVGRGASGFLFRGPAVQSASAGLVTQLKTLLRKEEMLGRVEIALDRPDGPWIDGVLDWFQSRDKLSGAPTAGVSLGLFPDSAAMSRLADTLDVPNLRHFRLDCGVWSLQGASEAQALGLALSGLVEALREGEKLGIEPAKILGNVEFALHLDPTFFLGIATLRAARLAIAQVASACRAADAAANVRLIAAVSARSLSRWDPWVNILRVTAATFAATVGGADVIVSEAYDGTRTIEPSPLGRRLARHTPYLLAEEGKLHLVQDPAFGSHALETLTEQVGASAWAVMQHIERAGGLRAATAAGMVESLVASSADTMARDVARRKRVVVGVSEYALASEPDAPPSEVDLADPRRWAAPWEALRDRTAALGREGRRPRVLLVLLGGESERSARETFGRGLLQAAGFEAIEFNVASRVAPILDGDQPELLARAASEIAQALGDCGAKVAMFCGHDTTYPNAVPPLAHALKAAAAKAIVVLGRPEENENAWREAGVTEWVAVGSDVLASCKAWLSLEAGA